MLDRQIIQNAGAGNVEDSGVIIGFQFRVRMPNYRGLWASLIEGIDVSVDGAVFERDVSLWRLQGRTYSLNELRATTDVRWQLNEAAGIFVPQQGGLMPGVHQLQVGIALRAPYIPAEFLPWVFQDERRVVILP